MKEKLTAAVETHADVVPDHMRHRSGYQVRLVGVDVDAETHRFGSAHRVGRGHTGSAGETFATVERRNDVDQSCDIQREKEKERERELPICFSQWMES